MGLMHCTLCGVPPKHYNNISNGKPAFFFALHIFQHMRLYSHYHSTLSMMQSSRSIFSHFPNVIYESITHSKIFVNWNG